MNSSTLFCVVLVGFFASQITDAARMKSAFAKLYASAGAALVADLIEQPEGPSLACVDKVTIGMREDLANQKIDVEDEIFRAMGESRTYEKMCRIYRENVKSFEGARREKRNFKNDLECVADMEKSMTVRCQESCLDNEGEDPSRATLKLVEPVGACRLSYCTLRCVANQVQECDNGDAFKAAYNDIGAAQMFLGLEERVANRANRAHQIIKSQKVPIKCRTAIQKAISTAAKVITAKPKPVRTPISVVDV